MQMEKTVKHMVMISHHTIEQLSSHPQPHRWPHAEDALLDVESSIDHPADEDPRSPPDDERESTSQHSPEC